MPTNTEHLLALAAELGAALKARNMMLTLAESCTGGMVAEHITAIAGSSAWFGVGFVTYSNEAKQQLLNVFHRHLLTLVLLASKLRSKWQAARLKKVTPISPPVSLALPGQMVAQRQNQLARYALLLRSIIKAISAHQAQRNTSQAIAKVFVCNPRNMR